MLEFFVEQVMNFEITFLGIALLEFSKEKLRGLPAEEF